VLLPNLCPGFCACEELRQIASDDATFLSRVITGDESWIYSYHPETKQQSFQEKSPNSPRRVKSKVKSMFIIFSDIKGIVHKEFILAGRTVNSAYYCDILQSLCENVERLWQHKRSGCCATTTTHLVTLPF
jgi:hypothetical protein